MCYCCSVCHEKCGCEEEIESSKGIFKLLDISIPYKYNDIDTFITEKKRELEDSDQSTNDSEHGSISDVGEDSDDMELEEN